MNFYLKKIKNIKQENLINFFIENNLYNLNTFKVYNEYIYIYILNYGKLEMYFYGRILNFQKYDFIKICDFNKNVVFSYLFVSPYVYYYLIF